MANALNPLALWIFSVNQILLPQLNTFFDNNVGMFQKSSRRESRRQTTEKSGPMHGIYRPQVTATGLRPPLTTRVCSSYASPENEKKGVVPRRGTTPIIPKARSAVY